jgi:hypothetical protein
VETFGRAGGKVRRPLVSTHFVSFGRSGRMD